MHKDSPFIIVRRKVLFEYLEKYPDVPSNQIARMLNSKYPKLFLTKELARSIVRLYRGAIGDEKRKTTKVTKYYRNV
jgi:hypothetical protein